MSKKTVWIIIVIVAVVLIGWGVGKNNKMVDGEKIKVGAVLPLSGTGSYPGEEVRKGMQMCNPGNLEFVFEDSANSAATGVTAYNKLMQIDKPDIIIVTNSTVVPAILPIAKSNKDFVITTLVTAAEIGKNGGDTVFRYYSDGYKASQVIADSMINSGSKNIGILYVQNEFGETYKKGAEDFLKNKDVVIYPESFLATEVDFSTSLLKLKQNKVDAIMIVAYDKQTLQIITKIKDLKLEADVFSAWMWNDSDFEKNPEIFNGIYAARSYFLFGSGDKVVNFKTDFMTKYNSIPSQFAAIGCDLAILLGENNIRTPEQLTRLESFNGINGKIIQAEYGEFDFPIQVIQYKRDETKSLN